MPTDAEVVSALGPIDPSSIRDGEQEKSAPWIVRKLVGVSMNPFRLRLIDELCT